MTWQFGRRSTNWLRRMSLHRAGTQAYLHSSARIDQARRFLRAAASPARSAATGSVRTVAEDAARITRSMKAAVCPRHAAGRDQRHDRLGLLRQVIDDTLCHRARALTDRTARFSRCWRQLSRSDRPGGQAGRSRPLGELLDELDADLHDQCLATSARAVRTTLAALRFLTRSLPHRHGSINELNVVAGKTWELHLPPLRSHPSRSFV